MLVFASTFKVELSDQYSLKRDGFLQVVREELFYGGGTVVVLGHHGGCEEVWESGKYLLCTALVFSSSNILTRAMRMGTLWS